MNERFGSLTQGYAPKPGDQHHEWEEQVPQTRGQGRSQGRSQVVSVTLTIFLLRMSQNSNVCKIAYPG